MDELIKTPNTLENKARFFAVYYDQLLAQWSTDVRPKDPMRVSHTVFSSMSEEWYLDLKSLHKVEGEDTIQIGKIEGFAYTEDFNVRGKKLIYNIVEFGDAVNPFPNFRCTIKVIDYLRSKEYALSWLDLSLNDLISYGWIKVNNV